MPCRVTHAPSASQPRLLPTEHRQSEAVHGDRRTPKNSILSTITATNLAPRAASTFEGWTRGHPSGFD